jgi:DNA-3-methyladenine glycosylase
MRRRRGLHDERALCSGPGKLCEALDITIKQSELPLDVPPFALHARTDKPEIVTGAVTPYTAPGLGSASKY